MSAVRTFTDIPGEETCVHVGIALALTLIRKADGRRRHFGEGIGSMQGKAIMARSRRGMGNFHAFVWYRQALCITLSKVTLISLNLSTGKWKII